MAALALATLLRQGFAVPTAAFGQDVPASHKASQDVITQKIGASDMFIFPSGATAVKRIGTIKVGNTITIKYGIRVARNQKARFVAMDSSKVPRGIKPKLQTNEGDASGFVVEDKAQATLHVYFDEGLTKKIAGKANRKEAGQQVMSRESNLSVEFTNENGKIKISRVTVN